MNGNTSIGGVKTLQLLFQQSTTQTQNLTTYEGRFFFLPTIQKDVKNIYYFNEERERWEGRERIDFLYIICWYNLYYFNEFYVKREIEMLGKL